MEALGLTNSRLPTTQVVELDESGECVNLEVASDTFTSFGGTVCQVAVIFFEYEAPGFRQIWSGKCLVLSVALKLHITSFV